MIYNIVLNSANLASGVLPNGQHYFDWTVLPESQYKVTFSFMSGPVNLLGFTSIPLLYVDLGQTTFYSSSNNSITCKTTQFLGCLQPNLVSGNSYLNTNRETNTILYLLNRPSNNQFSVKILNNINGNNWLDLNGANLLNYVLTLTLETIDK